MWLTEVASETMQALLYEIDGRICWPAYGVEIYFSSTPPILLLCTTSWKSSRCSYASLAWPTATSRGSQPTSPSWRSTRQRLTSPPSPPQIPPVSLPRPQKWANPISNRAKINQAAKLPSASQPTIPS